MDSILPLIYVQEDIKTEIIKNIARGKSFNFDFVTGDFVLKNGKVEELTGLESLEIWIIKLLKTEKHKFKIYKTAQTDNYGITLMDLAHSDNSYFVIKCEIQREIKEELLKNAEILSVSDFVFTREKRTLTVAFTVKSIYGPSKSEVIF
ncbi:DUF2634 domain-containing protein [Clostridium tagluense]|uniref:DUF2634 domain-containing protein n=1 Tax=Clostridium tagluense TaxID=360422 RepID=UPI001CF2D5DF|nr:DUF2634 domain-containing protein [Clostridium tagluense]MCB2310644.1 DUF2634 domain-containing protein [Clostridium tagluense]MCB2315625.1 DUF2634 domain-containing protein [Clostridium tagluense]MCB2320479.1 DUF2634 domain-containing protein [Clostridium tagluense]MCB2325238.1 DUF2634 domain-containing protein [Clostridium tagluense]MCB2330090.1 DUF2634 domain-containing protein [Clostridium tagluense]